MKKKSVGFLLIVALLSFLFVGCGKKENSSGEKKGNEIYRTLEEIKKSKKVVIGVFGDKGPFGYVDSKGEYQGYDLVFARRLAKDLGVEAEFIPTDPANRTEYLKTGKADIMLANFTVTDERKKIVDFAMPYMKVSLGVVSPDSDVIKDVKELKGKTLIVAKGTTADTYFTKHHPEVKLLKFDQYAEIFNALKDGRGDALSTDNTEVLAWAGENKGFTVGIKTLGKPETIAAAVSKGNTTLLNFINDDMKELGKENFFHKDFEKTLKPVYKDLIAPDDIVVEGGKVN